MRITHLHIKNIASLKGEFHIDFTQDCFQQNPIFAITGDIGAGKSSLLDAMCLALYQKTPRVSKTTANELNAGQVCTHGCDDAYAKLEFEVKGERYRSTWMTGKISRGENKGQWKDNAVDFEHFNGTAFVGLENANKKTEHQKFVATHVGLSYDQFEKTILLAQGNFSKLLKDKEEERTKIIEELTDTEHYREIGKKVFETTREKVNAWRQLEAELKGAQDNILDTEALKNLDETIQQLKKDLKETNTTIAQQNKKLELIKSYQNLIDQQTTLQQKLDVLKVKEQEILVMQKEVVAHDNAINIWHVYTQWQKIAGDLEKTKTDTTNCKQKSAELLQKENELIRSLKEALPKLNASDISSFGLKKAVNQKIEVAENIAQDIRNLEHVLQLEGQKQDGIIKKRAANKEEIERTTAEIKKVDGSLQSIRSFFSKNTLSLTEAEQIMNDLEAWQNKVRNLNSQIHGIFPVVNLDDAENRQENLDELPGEWKNVDINEVQEQYKKIKDKLDEYKAEYKNQQAQWSSDEEKVKDGIAIQNKIITIQNENLVFQDTIKTHNKNEETLQNKESSLVKDLQELKSTFKNLHLNNTSEVLQLRTQLIPQEPCMVCGSTEHPLADPNHQLIKTWAEQKLKESALELNIENIKKQRQKNKDALLLTQNRSDSNVGQLQELEKDLKKKRATLSIYKIEADKALNLNRFETAKKEALQQSEAIITKENQRLDRFIQAIEHQYINALVDIKKSAVQTEMLLNSKTENLPIKIKEINAYSRNFQVNKKEESLHKENIEKLKNQLSIFQEVKVNIEAEFKEITRKIEEKNIEKSLLQKKLCQHYQPNKDLKSFKQQTLERIDKIEQEKKWNAQTLTNLEEQLKTQSSEYETLSKNLNLQLKEKNFADVENLKLAKLNDENLKSKKQKIDQFQDDKKATIAQLKSVQDRLEREEKPSPEDLAKRDDFAELKAQNETKRDQLNADLGGKNQAVKNNQDQLKSIETRMAALKKSQTESAPYQLLNDLIGDARGNKFATLAARYTCNTLLSLANYHLESLKSRYRFKALNPFDQGEEDLMVMDAQLGNSVRPAKSTLSGGESFLVSLCLALGLSDLSANKVQINSLFIDEGFGSLDSDSLHDAISLLENLPESTGKSIGIISHVEALKQRIPIRIELKKQGNGFSTLKLPY